MKKFYTPVAVTMGEPAGVGPELCLHALNSRVKKPLMILGDADCLAARAKKLKIPFKAEVIRLDDKTFRDPGRRAVIHIPLDEKARIGKPSAENAPAVLAQIKTAARCCARGLFSAMVTAPVQKSSILAAGFDFVGQTEYVAECARQKNPLMLLAGKKLRVALATTHLPLAKVPRAINAKSLFRAMKTLNDGLQKWFNIKNPRIMVAGLNPHCGEGGYLGDEEAAAIVPAIRRARKNNIDAMGPFSADSVFVNAANGECDCVLAMYHDQGLPVSKFAGADGTTNITLGLPFLRTSPAHGTALDIAGTGKARPAGMLAAVKLAAGE